MLLVLCGGKSELCCDRTMALSGAVRLIYGVSQLGNVPSVNRLSRCKATFAESQLEQGTNSICL